MLATLSLLASEAPNGNQLPSDIREVYWGTIAFFLVVALIIKLAGPAIMNALNGRTERIQGEFDAAQMARSEAETALNAANVDLPDVTIEAQRIKGEAVATAAKLKVDIVEKANAEAEALKAKAITDIETQSRQALTDMRSEVAGMTREATEEVVVAELDAGAQASLIDSYINNLGSMA